MKVTTARGKRLILKVDEEEKYGFEITEYHNWSRLLSRIEIETWTEDYYGSHRYEEFYFPRFVYSLNGWLYRLAWKYIARKSRKILHSVKYRLIEYGADPSDIETSIDGVR